jgi:hypothetical protein
MRHKSITKILQAPAFLAHPHTCFPGTPSTPSSRTTSSCFPSTPSYLFS